ncbi:uncharacterized protein SPPG_06961 [Spizellomyces punctatus DAOM BR117]|uniref:Uncharacterized protein n=1 Tax=Spizellomyces punctatus (strain DAOM BR117) TaxID=645134 RepID=A0A0L0H9V9_SPIPD|nr:uncharacterized protein SPPG_06961 [Spizellomyces punctatus DAOM BR117]KNC97972.1 hypothetical protein SPPG_06961 [Spizellomyces punctatus DAOM BR117]|eukprot:XP_016606012.1 hypothetical protein SPPG_06961 [Spizellomyces punctatus DAOM BR117]
MSESEGASHPPSPEPSNPAPEASPGRRRRTRRTQLQQGAMNDLPYNPDQTIAPVATQVRDYTVPMTGQIQTAGGQMREVVVPATAQVTHTAAAVSEGGDRRGRDTLKLKLELNLDVDVQLKARVHGDITLSLL